MAFPRKYTTDFIADAVHKVEQARAGGRRGPISAVARDLDIDRRLLQDWVSEARADATPPAVVTATPLPDPDPVLLPVGLLHCRLCQEPMTAAFTPAGLLFTCPPPCRRHPLDAAAVTRTIGQAVLRYAPHVVPALTHPRHVDVAAAHAHRVIARVTAGLAPTDLLITWHPVPAAGCRGTALANRLRLARDLAATDPHRAHAAARGILTGVDPTTTTADTNRAEAALLLAELRIRLGNPEAAIRWATFAHHSLTHLHGPAAPPSLAAAFTRATAHRQAGHHQRAYRLYRQLAEQLSATVGPDAHQTLATQATIALVLRELGHCGPARAMLADAITAHRRAHPGHPATGRMASQLQRLRQDCTDGKHEHSHQDAPA
ncbi:hypothetical protein AB0L34_33475 [Micromonospora sp. NPDC052213]|uniref:hypothetical protein n=1 Tax=Micromonospora sp. NPDC052213 TaxID=3155812 RepID=UPI00343D325A